MPNRALDFGFYPEPLHITAGPITIVPLPGLDRLVEVMRAAEGVADGGIYARPSRVRDMMTGAISERPYSSRVFGLRKTHRIEHATATSDDQLAFHLWSLSFFTGMRLTAAEAGFLDATPLKPGSLVDFIATGAGLTRSVELAEAFWIANASNPRQAQRFEAAVHALFLAQNPQNLQFEKFVYLYMALDACYALAAAPRSRAGSGSHAQRIAWLCRTCGVALPTWADPASPGGVEVAALRNDTLHEALFAGEPLGFAVHGAGTNRHLTLEMHALTCRLLVALLGGATAGYVRTPTDTRQMHGLDLP